MKLTSENIFKEYNEAKTFKEGIGTRGISEQNRINERFYMGDQWHGANCGNERPLVRHNIIKRIGDYKMSQILSSPISISFSADGISNMGMMGSVPSKRTELANGGEFDYNIPAANDEINTVLSALSDYHKVTCERTGFENLCERALKNAYIGGSGVIYTYWNSEIKTGLYGGKNNDIAIKGDIECEVLDIENVFFGDPNETNLQAQPYIIIKSEVSCEALLREAEKFGASAAVKSELSSKDKKEKIPVLTRLYKEYNSYESYTIKCIKVIEGGVLRGEFDTGLHKYPLAIFNWDNLKNTIYGQSEVTYLIPNQIAINRMITANVWSMMSAGMPIMVVNGDTVTGKITNEPGQIIKVYGSNEDVAGSIKYVTPEAINLRLDESINTLIENTLTQSGANQVALGDSKADNASALITMRTAAIMPISLVKNRFYNFVEEIAKIWLDFWLTHYGNRKIKVVDENGIWYMPFNAERYADLIINAKVNASVENIYGENESMNALNMLYDKGIINKKQFLKRIPEGLVSDMKGILAELEDTEVDEYDGA